MKSFGIGALLLLIVVLWNLPFSSNPVVSVAQAAQQPVPVPASDVPQMPKPFAHWPQNQKPEAVFVLSGQTWGYLRPCGCSAKQLGGLERRRNLIDGLKAKGWTVAGIDLGDVAPKEGLPDQVLLKYKTLMQSLKQMGYIGIGVGMYDIAQDFDKLTGQYSLQAGNEKPSLLAGNLKRKNAPDRAKSFPTGGNTPPYVDDAIVEKVGNLSVGVVGVIESTDAMKATLAKLTSEFELLSNPQVLPVAKQKLDQSPAKPNFRVLIYQGNAESAAKVAKANPEYQLILCQSDDLPPMFPTYVNDGNTAIVQSGQKGQRVGVAGVFRQPNGKLKIEYQLIELDESYLTPKDPALEAKQDILQLLQKYAEQVRDDNYLADAAKKKVPHAAQIKWQGAKLQFVGSDACRSCHEKEFEVWDKSKHATALKFLEDPKYSNRPTLRNFDPECVVCHTVGFKEETGFVSKEKTPKLQHVGCESCHGPGSGHVAMPNNKQLHEFMSPWKTKPEDRLPKKELIEEIGKQEPIKRAQSMAKQSISEAMVVQNVTRACMTCHDPENDPKFDLYEYIPKIWHSDMKKK